MTDRNIAHAALSLTEPPYLHHYREGRFREWRGVAFIATEIPRVAASTSASAARSMSSVSSARSAREKPCSTKSRTLPRKSGDGRPIPIRSRTYSELARCSVTDLHPR